MIQSGRGTARSFGSEACISTNRPNGGRTDGPLRRPNQVDFSIGREDRTVSHGEPRVPGEACGYCRKTTTCTKGHVYRIGSINGEEWCFPVEQTSQRAEGNWASYGRYLLFFTDQATGHPTPFDSEADFLGTIRSGIESKGGALPG